MPAEVLLTVTQGKLAGKEFRFDERTTCIVGRSKECAFRLPNDKEHAKISRHHCLLDINPPDIRIRDFGSLNGTFVNGTKIGQRKPDQSRKAARAISFPEHDLKQGDAIKLGDTVFRVSVRAPAACIDCTGEIPENEKENCRIGGALFRCPECRKKQEEAKRAELARRVQEAEARKPAAPKPQPSPKACCAVCKKDVSGEIGAMNPANYICLSCRKNPAKLIFWMLNAAKKGKEDLIAIQGYVIEKELGRGGMGRVYLAKHEKTGNRVALKVMLPEVAASKNSQARFLRETAMTQTLNHPNVVKLYDHGCSQGTFFFTLEFCDGGGMDAYMLKRGGRLPVDEAVNFMLQLLDGLAYAHTATIPNVLQKDGTRKNIHGIVHRDIKPGNFFLSGTGPNRKAKIADYGFAKAFDAAGLSGLTMTGSVAGTPSFMPRQQVINFKYAKPEVDVWAMAASLYNMLTGFVPRNFRRRADPWMILLKEKPVPILQRNPVIPAKLAKTIDLALVDNPAITFKSAVEFKKALEAAMS